MNILTISYNNKKLTNACIQSIIKSTPNTQIYIIDNSDIISEKLDPLEYQNYKNISIIDNFSGKLINVNNIFDEQSIWTADVSHTYTVQWFMDNYNIPFLLLDSDVIIKQNLHKFVYNENLICIGAIVEEKLKRVFPCICYINTILFKKYNIQFFNKNRIIKNFLKKQQYITGQHLYEDLQKINKSLYDIQDIYLSNIYLFINHFGGGAWKTMLNNHYISQDFLFMDWAGNISEEDAIKNHYIKYNYNQEVDNWLSNNKKYFMPFKEKTIINTNNKKYAIAVIFNDAYIKGAQVFLSTFLKYNPWYKGDIICIYDNKYCILSEENKNLIQSQFPNVYFHCVKDNLYDKFVEHFYNIMLFKRFSIVAFTIESFALKYDQNGNEYDRVVYFDIDQIVEGDLSLLFDDTKNIIVAPGDNLLINDINNDSLYNRIIPLNISGGLFSIGKKYLGEDIRDEILHFGETFKLNNPEYGEWTGACPEMHVLNVWLLNKDVWFVPSTYAFPSIILENKKYIDNKFISIMYMLLKNSKIIHIWGDKPWQKISNKSKLDKHWDNLYNSLIKNSEALNNLNLYFYDEFNNIENTHIKLNLNKYILIKNFLSLK